MPKEDTDCTCGRRIETDLWQITATRRNAAAIKAETEKKTTTGIRPRGAKDVVFGEASTPQTDTGQTKTKTDQQNADRPKQD